MAATVLAACNALSSPASPSLEPKPTRSVPFQTGVPSPSATPSHVGPYAVLPLPSDGVRTLSLDEELGEPFRLHRYSGWGPRVVFDSFNEEYNQNLYLADLQSGSLEVLASVPQPGWEIWEPDISEDRVVWTEYRYDDPANYAGSLTFRLMARNLADDTSMELASGVHTRLEGIGAIPPVIRVDGNKVAYAIEHTRPGHPLGWRVTLQSLISGEVERSFDTDLDLYKLDLSEGNVVYSEGQADLEISYKYGLRLMLSTPDHPNPVEIARDAYDVAISGERFAWMSDPAAGSARSPMPIHPVIMTATVSDHTPIQVSITTSAPEPPPAGWGPPRFGGMFPAVGEGLVAWHDKQTDALTWAGQLDRLPVWDSRTGVAYQLEPAAEPLFVQLAGGWLTWFTDISPDGETVTHVFHGLPISELPLPAASR
jgi:hypothetical protein